MLPRSRESGSRRRPFGGKFGPGAEKKRGWGMLMEDADLPLKRRVALLGATLKAQPGAGGRGAAQAERAGVPKCGKRFSSHRVQARVGGAKCPDQCSATRQERLLDFLSSSI